MIYNDFYNDSDLLRFAFIVFVILVAYNQNIKIQYLSNLLKSRKSLLH